MWNNKRAVIILLLLALVTSLSPCWAQSFYANSHALLIGINKYPNLPEQVQLHWAVNDVTYLRKVLVESYGFPDANITVLTDKDATKQAIISALSNLADNKRVKKEDRVLIYFSGHGQTVKTEDGDMGFLLPCDANVDLQDKGNPGPYLKTAVGMQSIWDYVGASAAKHVLILADACHGGLLARSRGQEDLSSASLQVLAKKRARQAITGGDKGQLAIERSEWGHGAFTYKLLEELNARTAEMGKPFTTAELYASLLNSVGNATNGKQTPQSYARETDGQFLFVPVANLAVIPPAPAVPVETTTIEQVSTSARIMVTSDPSGASVWVDDVEMQGLVTPCDVDLDLGAAKNKKVEIALKLEGHKDVVYTITALRGKSVALNCQLAARPAPKPAIAVPPKTVRPPVVTQEPVAQERRKGDVAVNPKDGAEMVWVPAGEFIMGSTNNYIAAFLQRNPDLQKYKNYYYNGTPQRKVHLDGYWMYKYEVTLAQYGQFCSETGRATPEAPWGWIDSHPVVKVSWQDAADYAQWAGASLPTEAQWEKAARGTDGRPFPWGNFWDASKCVNESNSNSSTQPVGSKPTGASPYGCMDMAGNVWEWCADWYAEDYYKSAPYQNPMGPSRGSARVLRGGSWCLVSDFSFQCARRDDFTPDSRNNLIGFRCARTP